MEKFETQRSKLSAEGSQVKREGYIAASRGFNPAGGGPPGHLPRGGGIYLPPRISETTGRIRKIQTVFASPLKFVEVNLISLTSGLPMTSQVRSKIKCFTVHGSSR